MLVARPDQSPIKPLAASFADEPDGIGFSRSPEVMPAHVALSPNQLEARIEVYAELARQRRPLDKDGPPEQDENPRYRCWGCGVPTPYRETGGQMTPCKAEGWVIVKRPHIAANYSESWCPECAAMPGFGCVEEEEPAESPVSLR